MQDQTILFPIGHPFIELDTVDSTNNYAMAQLQQSAISHGSAYFAYNQTAGKGQRGKSWTTNRGENLILSVVLQPTQLNPRNLFYLSATIANACYDFFKKYAGAEVSIKWPNDVYWRDRKAGGILIENIFRGDAWTYSIVGVGLNINQSSFDSALKNPVSLKQITGRVHDPLVLAKELCETLTVHYGRVVQEREGVIEYYNAHLFNKGRPAKLRQENVVFETIISGVTNTGQLITYDSITRHFDFGQVEWIL